MVSPLPYHNSLVEHKEPPETSKFSSYVCGSSLVILTGVIRVHTGNRVPIMWGKKSELGSVIVALRKDKDC